MEKSIFTREYAIFAELLRETREAAKMTQTEVGERLGRSQSLVAKYERGEVRLDIVQIRSICHVLGTTLPALVKKYEKRLAQSADNPR